MKRKRTRKPEKRPALEPVRRRTKGKSTPSVPPPSAPPRELFRLIFDSLNDSVFVHEMNPDGSPGRFLDVNDATCRRLGYTKEEFLKLTVKDINDPGPFKAMPADAARARSEVGAVFERVHVATDGRKIPVEISARIVEMGGRAIGISVARDITERKNAERALVGALEDLKENQAKTLALVAGLRESEERFKAVTATTLDAVILSDADGMISLWNRGAENIFGHTESEAKGRPVEIVLPERLVPEHRKGWERFRSGQSTKPVGKVLECTGRRKDGTEFPIELSHFHWTSARMPCFGTIIRDITDRKAAEDELKKHRDFLGQMVDKQTGELKKSEERYKVLAEAAHDSIFILSPNQRILYVNEFAAAQLGKTPAEVVGKTKEEAGLAILSDEDPEKFAALFGKGEGFAQEVRARFPAGERWLSVTFSPIRGEGGQVESAVGIARDVTERKQLEEQLAQAQKLESIGQLAGGVAHDFNNLLSVIISYTGFVYDEIPKDSKFRADLHEVRKAADRATALTRQLLAFSRKQAVTPREVSVKDSVGNLAKMLKRLIGEHVLLEIRVAEDTGVVFIDPSQLEQVIINVAVNARDAMPGGGNLLIEAKNVSLDAAQITHAPDVEAGDYVMLAVSDTGTGIPREILPKIFEPFFTTKERGKGTSLGLSMVYGIVKQNKGHLEVESVVGTGTVFRLFFRRDQRESAGQAAGAQVELPGGRGETILVVEDEDVVRTSIARLLKGAGYAVIEASGGAAALDRFREKRAGIAAVVTDVIMPGMGGAALVSEIRKLDPAAKILFCSGYPDEMAGAQGGLPPGTVMIGKPVDKAELLTRIRDVLDHSGDN